MRRRLTEIQVLHGPDSTVDREWLRTWALDAAAEWNVDVEVIYATSESGLLGGLARRNPEAGIILCTDQPTALTRAASLEGSPVIWLGMQVALGPPPQVLVDGGVQTVRGRGVDGHRWALRSLLARSEWPLVSHPYGPSRDQAADLRLPEGGGPYSVAVLIHGGAWRANWERDLMDAMAVDLARHGYATWNLEYRRVGDGGGWPSSFEDVAAGIDTLARVDAPLDLHRVAFIGHSAGGQLALWAAARANSAITPALVVSLAGVPDLVEGARRGVYERAVDALMGGMPDQVPDRYGAASPYERLPLAVPQLLIHGTADLPDNVDMNRRYAARALAAGDAVQLIELPEVDHFAVIEPRSAAWTRIEAELERRVPSCDPTLPKAR